MMQNQMEKNMATVILWHVPGPQGIYMGTPLYPKPLSIYYRPTWWLQEGMLLPNGSRYTNMYISTYIYIYLYFQYIYICTNEICSHVL